MSDRGADDTGGSRRNVGAHPSPQVHLFVDSQDATERQAHTIRGFLSIVKKKGANIEVIKRADETRAYHLMQ